MDYHPNQKLAVSESCLYEDRLTARGFMRMATYPREPAGDEKVQPRGMTVLRIPATSAAIHDSAHRCCMVDI